MGEQHARDWTRMTPDEFDRDAPLRRDAAGAVTVPAVPDECGTAPLFGDERAAPPARSTADRGRAPIVDQPPLF
ncbi:hypothetical protein [Streptomyces sp. NPDC005385]|uniref:hypothetical protein n=1 Tax=Streptomyces sp. NPDC005385 TaxID=3157039 RepID=UPI0033B87F30